MDSMISGAGAVGETEEDGTRQAGGGANGDRRDDPRLSAENGAATSLNGNGHSGLPRVAEVADVSRGGLRLMLNWDSKSELPLSPGDQLNFDLRLGEQGASLGVSGRVKWVAPDKSRGRISAGVEFVDLDEETSQALDRDIVRLAFDGREIPNRQLPRGGAARAAPESRPRRRKLFLGEILVNRGVIDTRRLNEFLSKDYSGREQLGAELVRQGLVAEQEIARALAEQNHLPYLDLSVEVPDLDLAASLPWAVFERYRCLPVRREHGVVLLAVSTNPTLQMVDELKAALGHRVRMGVAADSQLVAWRRRMGPLRYVDLVKRELLTQDQLEEAQALAWRDGISLETALVSFCRLPRHEILAALGRHFRCATYEFNPYAALPDSLKSYCHDRRDALAAAGAVPVAIADGSATVALIDPRNRAACETVRSIFSGMRVDILAAPPDDVLAALGQMFGEPGAPSGVGQILEDLAGLTGLTGLAGRGGESVPLAVMPQPEQEEDDPDIRENDSAVVRLVNSIVEDASAKGASDIHIEPSRETVIVRYRIDGVLHRASSFKAELRSAVVSRIKIMADLDIAERRKPQSGKIRFRRRDGTHIELRVEIVPSVGGIEDAVVRLLSASTARALPDIDLSQHNLAEMKRLIAMPYGLILCVGPTGSGKTTTLHSALGYINREDSKILTVEDPVEITQRGLRQVQINPRAGVTFASALRSFLRADPDIIMIGEMRDRETAGIAVEASMTGHLVFSTLHTNTAPETIVRLLEMGIESYTFADALLGVLAQRLVRRLCTECSRPAPLGEAGLTSLRHEHGSDEIFDALGARPESVVRTACEHGCPACHSSGFRGRLGIHELLSVSDTIRDMICHRATVSGIRRQAMDEGMRTLKQDGINKVLLGLTSREEVRGACAR